MKKIVCVILAGVIALSVTFSGCSGSADKEMVGDNASPGWSDQFTGGFAGDYDNSAGKPTEEPSEDMGDGFLDGGLGSGVTERKRIQYVTIAMETLEFDRTVSELKSRAASVGGYIDSSRETGQSIYGSGSRSAELVLRIPTDALDNFTGDVASLGSILSQYTTTNDVTDSYYDTEARLASLELQRDKYMELLDRADDMVYIIELTNALTNVIYQIETLTGTLNKYDSLIAYSTVTVNISEVIKLTEEQKLDPTFGERLAEGFSDSVEAFVEMCQSLAVGFVSSVPFLVIPAIAAVVVIIVLRSRSKKRRRVIVIKNEDETK